MINTSSKSHRIISRGLWIVIPLGILLFYFLVDPMESGWMPQCVFHKLTGWQCMGCGSQRMAHALLHGNIQGAFEANAFVFCCLPILAVMIFVELNRKKFPKLYRRFHSLPVIITMAALLAAWLPLRNFLEI